MKKNIFIITICCFITGMTFSMQANAQARPDSVSVHAGQKPLTELLTDEQKETIKYLTVTGKLLDEDYKYIRESLIIKLKELNLRDADIDTIPEKALEVYYGHKEKEDITIILPERLKYLSDYSLCTDIEGRRIVITGKYPDVGKFVFHSNISNGFNIPFVSISDDNPFLKEYYGSIYSLDGGVLYYYMGGGDLEYPDEKLKIIAPCAIECKLLGGLLIPETVDSIGDRAFAYMEFYYPTRNYWLISCRALVPPRLGKDAFIESYLKYETMYVPEKSLELYKATEGWKELYLEGSTFIIGIRDNFTDKVFQIFNIGTTYKITASKNIKDIEIYDIKGRLTNEIRINSKEASINKATLAKPYAIAKITFENNISKNIKLIP